MRPKVNVARLDSWNVAIIVAARLLALGRFQYRLVTNTLTIQLELIMLLSLSATTPNEKTQRSFRSVFGVLFVREGVSTTIRSIPAS